MILLSVFYRPVQLLEQPAQMSIFGTIVKHVACFLVANFAFGLATTPLGFLYSGLEVPIEGWHTFFVVVVGLVAAIIAYRYTLSLFARNLKDKGAQDTKPTSEPG